MRDPSEIKSMYLKQNKKFLSMLGTFAVGSRPSKSLFTYTTLVTETNGPAPKFILKFRCCMLEANMFLISAS